MKTQHCTFGVIFYLKKQKTTAQGKAPIYARVTVNGKRTEISVKRSVAVSGWDAKKGLAKGRGLVGDTQAENGNGRQSTPFATGIHTDKEVPRPPESI